MNMTEEPDRNLFLFDNVDEKSAKEIVSHIYKINTYDDKEEKTKRDYVRDPIKLVIDSCGGHCSSMFAIIDAVINSKTPVYTHASGVAYSAAAMITLCGKNGYRTASKYSSLMIHDAYSYFEGKTIQLENEMEQRKLLNMKMLELFKNYTTVPQDVLDKFNNSGQEIYLTADKALEYGIIDEIV